MHMQQKGRLLRMLRKAVPVSFLVVVLVLLTSALGQQPVREHSGERVPPPPDIAVQRNPTPLSLNIPGAFREGSNIYSLAPVSAQEIAAADRAAAAKSAHVRPGPPRVGLVRSVGAVPLSIKGDAALQSASIQGGEVWTMAIRSPGAFGMRIHFTNFDVNGGSVLVYARDGDSVITRGPYTQQGPHQNGEFWTASLPGDTVFIEVSGTDDPHVEVPEILHFDKDRAGAARDLGEVRRPATLSCHLDAMCYDSPPVHPVARDAVGQMNFVDGGSVFACTGTLLNDLDEDTQVPYFLTAYHCLSTQAVVNTLEVVYLWQRDSCDGPLPDYDQLPRSMGGMLLATNVTNSGNDMTFIRLAGIVPGGVSLAGWTTTPLPSNVTGIHHPNGGWKRVTFLHNEKNVRDCRSTPTSQYYYLEADAGVVEGGASGSGIFDDQGQLRGQLLGVCPGNVEDECGNRERYNYLYGKFSVTYPRIRQWLEIGGTIHVDRNYTGTELGTPSRPFRTVAAAYNFAWNGARIKIKAGLYPETLTLSKQVTLLADGGAIILGQ